MVFMATDTGAGAHHSFWCDRGDHGNCAHVTGGSTIRFIGANRGARSHLCSCSCHDACPVSGHSEVPGREWMDRCTCPGASSWKERRRQRDDATDARKALAKEAVGEVEAQNPRGRENIAR